MFLIHQKFSHSSLLCLQNTKFILQFRYFTSLFSFVLFAFSSYHQFMSGRGLSDPSKLRYFLLLFSIASCFILRISYQIFCTCVLSNLTSTELKFHGSKHYALFSLLWIPTVQLCLWKKRAWINVCWIRSKI